MNHIIYYEPKTGCVFHEEPREKNVYCIPNTPENRQKLKELTGPSRIAWLERESKGR